MFIEVAIDKFYSVIILTDKNKLNHPKFSHQSLKEKIIKKKKNEDKWQLTIGHLLVLYGLKIDADEKANQIKNI